MNKKRFKPFKSIIIAAVLITAFVIVGKVDGGTESGLYTKKIPCIVTVTITLENGHSYDVSVNSSTATVNTFNMSNPTKWEIVHY